MDDIQAALEDLSAQILDASTRMQQANALLLSRLREWQVRLAEIQAAVGTNDQPI